MSSPDVFAGHSVSGTVPTGRGRSKTFEEYQKDTTDAWDDREEEGISQLSIPAKLENELKQQHRGASSDSGAAPSRKRIGKGTKGEENTRFPVSDE